MWAEPWSWCRVALDLPGADVHPLRAGTLVHAGRGAWHLGDHASALALADEALSLVDRGSTTWCEAQIGRANALTFLGRLDDADAAVTAAVELGGDDAESRVLQRVATMLIVRYVAGRPEPEAARQLLVRACTSNPTTYALALYAAAMTVGDDDRAAAIAWNEQAVELAAASGAVFVQGGALVALASLEAAVDPVNGAKSYVAAIAHFLRVGNRAHVQVLGRGLIGPLVACGAHQAAATVDGATRSKAILPWDATTAPGRRHRTGPRRARALVRRRGDPWREPDGRRARPLPPTCRGRPLDGDPVPQTPRSARRVRSELEQTASPPSRRAMAATTAEEHEPRYPRGRPLRAGRRCSRSRSRPAGTYLGASAHSDGYGARQERLEVSPNVRAYRHGASPRSAVGGQGERRLTRH